LGAERMLQQLHKHYYWLVCGVMCIAGLPSDPNVS